MLKKLKWRIKEIEKMVSNQTSFYSKKRTQSWIAFFIGQWGMIHWLVIQLLKSPCNISSTDIGIWSGIEFAICGYMVNKIQQEKKDNKEETDK